MLTHLCRPQLQSWPKDVAHFAFYAEFLTWSLPPSPPTHALCMHTNSIVQWGKQEVRVGWRSGAFMFEKPIWWSRHTRRSARVSCILLARIQIVGRPIVHYSLFKWKPITSSSACHTIITDNHKTNNPPCLRRVCTTAKIVPDSSINWSADPLISIRDSDVFSGLAACGSGRPNSRIGCGPILGPWHRLVDVYNSGSNIQDPAGRNTNANWA